MEGVGEVSPVSGCCGLKLKKAPSPGGALEAWQRGKVNGPRKPREAQRGPKRVTRRGVGPAEKSEKSASDRVLVKIGRAHVSTPVTRSSRMPSSASKKKTHTHNN